MTYRAPALTVAIAAFTVVTQASATPTPVGGETSRPAPRSAPTGENAGAARAKPRDMKASVGEGGNDLTARIGIQGRGRLQPAMSLEFRAVAGAGSELLGPQLSSYRAQPEILMSVVPGSGVKLIAGGGLGSVYLAPIVSTDLLRYSSAHEDGVRVSMSGVFGAHFRWQRAPVAALLRTEAIGGAGWTTTLNLGLGLPGAR